MIKLMKTQKKSAKTAVKKNNNLNQAVKPNKSKVSFENSFLKGRYHWAIAFICFGLSALVARAAFVQAVNVETFSDEADKRSLREQKLLSARGSILDRNGQLLAVSAPVYNIKADPKFIIEGDYLQDKERWMALAKALGIPYKNLLSKINDKAKSRDIFLARQVSKDTADYISKLKLPGVVLKNDFRRFYPRAAETAHLIGFTNVDNEGIEGIENSFNALLEGKDGSRVYRKDKQGNIVEEISDVKKYEAQNVTLSIDEKLQSMVYREIANAVTANKANFGTAVLVDIRTGEILAMATAPSYNPNNRGKISEEIMRNRAITDTFEPGSTVKPFVVLTALQREVVRRNEVIDTGPLMLSGKEIKDVAPRDRQTLDEILENSSNRGVSRLALRMPPNALMDIYKQAGLGRRTDLGIVGEQPGNLWADRKHWSDIERANVAYGYGIAVTPVQLARAYVTLGSFGVYRPLSITKVDPPVIGNRVYSEKITKEVVNMMEKVAIKNKRAMVEGYRVAIKTGTAKKNENGRYIDKYMAYTAGIAPVSDPRFALVILIDDPKAGQYYGGAVSAPVFSNIMSYTLRAYNVTPDREITNKENKTSKRVVRLSHKSDSTPNN